MTGPISETSDKPKIFPNMSSEQMLKAKIVQGHSINT